jgi:hypothetical protein
LAPRLQCGANLLDKPSSKPIDSNPFLIKFITAKSAEVLSDDWAPHLPGINAPGKYEDYAEDPWKTIFAVIDRIQKGTYEGFYPPIKAKP